MLPRKKGHRSHSVIASELKRGVLPKLVRQHILLTLILRVSNPGAPSNREGVALIGSWTTICNLKAFRYLDTNPIIQLQM